MGWVKPPFARPLCQRVFPLSLHQHRQSGNRPAEAPNGLARGSKLPDRLLVSRADMITGATDSGLFAARAPARRRGPGSSRKNKATVKTDRRLHHQSPAFGPKAPFDMGQMVVNLLFTLVQGLGKFPHPARICFQIPDQLLAYSFRGLLCIHL